MTATSFTTPTTLPEKIAQLIAVRAGSNMPPATTVDQDEQRVAELLDRCPVGALLLFNGRWPSTVETLSRLQSRSKIPLLVGADIERGCGQQMHGLTVFPHAMAFGNIGNDVHGDSAASLVKQFGQLTAVQALASGIHATFAPVADANTNSKNPIIATRAFGSVPLQVAKLVAAFVRGAEGAGLATTAKHFPGHGDTQQDSHDSLPTVDRPRDSILSTEIPPFVAAIEAGCSMVMTSHVAYPALDPSGLPATLSKPIVTQFLREELGFEGVVCCDSLLMAGVRDRFASEGELCLATLQAGVDLLLDVDDPEAAVAYLVRAVEKGDLAIERIEQSLERILQLKARIIRPAEQPAGTGKLDGEALALAEQVARRAIAVVGASSPIELDPKRPLTAILLKTFATPLDPPEQPLAAALREQFASVAYFALGPDASDAEIEAARVAAASSEQLLVAAVVKPAAWHKFGLLDYQQQLVENLASHPGMVLASLGEPTFLEQYPQAAHRLCTFSDEAVSQVALAVYLRGCDR